MASRKEYNMLFQLNAQLQGGFNSSFKSAQDSVARMQDEIRSLNKTQSDISAYKRQEDALERNREKLKVLQEQYENIKKEISETKGYSSKLQNQLLTKEQQIDKTSRAIEGQTEKLGLMGSELEKAGVDAGNLTNESKRLETEIESLKNKQVEAADAAEKMGETTSAAFLAAGQALVAAGLIKALEKAKDLFMDFAEASMDFESGMAGVRRTTGASAEEVALLGDEFKKLSTEIPIVTDELNTIATTAGQLAIPKEKISEFTQIMAKLGTATDLTADSAATLLAQFANVTGTKDYDRLGATVAQLGDSTATTATKVVEIAQRISAAGATAGMSEAGMLSLSAAVGSIGVETQAAGTAMSTLISNLYKATRQGGDRLDDFARIAGYSSEQFVKAWEVDAVSALDAFLQGLNDVERNGKSAIELLEEVGINNVRQTRAILGLANAGDLLSNTIEQGNAAWQANTALSEKASIMYGTTEAKLKMLQNAWNNAKVAIGDNYTPALAKAYEAGTKLLIQVEAWIKKNPELVKGLTVLIGTVSAATAGLTAYAAAAKIMATTKALVLAAIPGAKIIMATVAAVAALAGIVAALTTRQRELNKEFRELSSSSKQNYREAERLKQEYKDVSSLMGETSAEAALLKHKMSEATAAFEQNKRKAEEVATAHRELISGYEELMGEHDKIINDIGEQDRSTQSLISRLEMLVSTEKKTAAAKKEISAIVDVLNNSIPGLELNYDNLNNTLNMTPDMLLKIAKAEAVRRANAAKNEKVIAALGEEERLQDGLARAVEERSAAEKEFALAKSRQLAESERHRENQNLIVVWAAMRNYNKEAKDAEETLGSLVEQENAAREAYEENERTIKGLSEELAGYTGSTEDGAFATANLSSELRTLAERYDEAYSAAVDSMEKQFQVWDRAETVVATSAATIMENIESQIKYWQDYDDSIKKVTETGKDIEGFSDFIASFADGSAQSIAAIKGMAGASEQELAKIVELYNENKLSYETASSDLALLQEDINGTLKQLADNYRESVTELDQHEAAKKAAENTIDAFVAGAEGKVAAVREAYASIARAAMLAVDDAFVIESPSRVMIEKAQMVWAGFIKGTELMQSKVEAATVETSLKGHNIVEATPNNTNASYVDITVSPVYHFNGEISQADVDNTTNDIRDKVMSVLEEIGIERTRVDY